MKLKEIRGLIKNGKNYQLVSKEINSMLDSELFSFNRYDFEDLVDIALSAEDYALAEKIVSREDFNVDSHTVCRVVYEFLSHNVDKNSITKVLEKANYSDISSQSVLEHMIERMEQGEQFGEEINKLLDNNNFNIWYAEDVLDKADKLEDKSLYNRLIKRGDVLESLVSSKTASTKFLNEVFSQPGLDINYRDGLILEHAFDNIHSKKLLAKIYNYPGVDYEKLDYNNLLNSALLSKNLNAVNFLLDNYKGDIGCISNGKVYYQLNEIKEDLLGKIVDRKDNGLNFADTYDIKELLEKSVRLNYDDTIKKVFDNQDFKYNAYYDRIMSDTLTYAIAFKHEDLAKYMISNCDFVINDWLESEVKYRSDFAYTKENGLAELISAEIKKQQGHEAEIISRRIKNMPLDKTPIEYIKTKFEKCVKDGGEASLKELLQNDDLKKNKYFSEILKAGANIAFPHGYWGVLKDILTDPNSDYKEFQVISPFMPRRLAHEIYNFKLEEHNRQKGYTTPKEEMKLEESVEVDEEKGAE